MTPERIDELAAIVDPDNLWRLGCETQRALPADKKAQLDAGIALRRHAQDQRDIKRAAAEGKSWIITHLGFNHTARRSIETPPDHARLRRSTT